MQILLVVLLAFVLWLQGCAQSGGPKTEKERAEAALIYSDLGLGYLRQGELEQALARLKRALELDSDHPAANHYIAEVYKQLGDIPQAEKHYQRAVQYDPRNPMVLNNYGAFLCDQSRFNDAEVYFLRAANVPRYQTPELSYENMALCAQRINNREKAEEYFRKALAINPKLPKSLYQMALLSHDGKELLKARAFLQRFHDVAPRSEQSLKLGISIEQGLSNEAAAQELRKVLRREFPEAVTE